MVSNVSSQPASAKCRIMQLKYLFPVLLLISIPVRSQDIIMDDEDDEPVKIEEVTEEEENKVEEIPYTTPTPMGNYYLAEHFDDRGGFLERWIKSEAKKDDAEDEVAKYDGKWDVEEATKSGLTGDLGLVLKSKAHHHAISTKLEKPFLFDNKKLILQYEVRFQNGQECGGAYLKLLSHVPNLDLRSFRDKTPYTLMFGPDKCGNDHKLHFIFRHRNPKNGSFEEKHWKKSSMVPKLDDVFKDKKPHLFTLVINPDNTFEVLVDKNSVHKGSLLEDFAPPVNPEPEIDDPTDFKPDNWDEREKIPDPTAVRPDDWDEDAPRQIPDPKSKKPSGWLDDEPELIPDPSASKPTDWDDEMDGEWEAPLINNPKCEKVGCSKWKAPMIDNPAFKGKWRPPLIDNPNYKGKWKPRRIANPDYFEDNHPYKMTPVAAVGFELWSMVDGIMFDNIIITDDMFVAEQWAAETFALKRELADQETDNVLTRLFKYTNKNPWLWAVYVVVIGLPVVLFISFCCTSPAPSRAQKESQEVLQSKLKMRKLQEQANAEAKEDTIQEVKEEEEEDEEPALAPAEVKPKMSPPVVEEKPDDSKCRKGSKDSEEGEADQEDEDEEEEENVKDEGEEQDTPGTGDYPRQRRRARREID